MVESPKPRSDVVRTVDEEARRLARTLLRTARFGSLGVIDPTDGSPSVSRVNLATAMNGTPLFLISRLSGHFAALEADPKASLLIGEPGKGDPIAHPRMTIIGRARQISDEPERQGLRSRFLMRHPKSALYADFSDFAFWLLTPDRMSLNGGFGKAFDANAVELLTPLDGLEALAETEANAVAHMNADHSDAVDHYAKLSGLRGSGWRLATVDPEGLDLVRGDEAERLWFDTPLRSADELRPTLVSLARKAAS